MYRLYFKKEKMIYQNLNKCIVSENFLDGVVWIPQDKLGSIKGSMNQLVKADESMITAHFSDVEQTNDLPPTYFKMNDLLYPFQEIVNTYGVPRYKEANPALFAIVTFPFLFGIMFGDIGHGFILFLFGIYLVTQKDEIIASKSILKAALKARYILLFMGFFAFYNGWMYNDFLSLPLNLFGSCYVNVS